MRPLPAARRAARGSAVLALATGLVGAGLVALAPAASATPVCTDGFRGGLPLSACGGRVFPEAHNSQAYVQYTPDPRGFSEYVDGLAYLEQKYPRWVDVFTLDAPEGVNDPKAVSSGPDRKRSTDPTDTGDGRKILIVRVTDKQVDDAPKEKLAFSLSVHGNEGGGLEGGLRTIEDLAIAAERNAAGDVLVDGVDNYASSTGKKPVFNSYKVRDVLAKEAVYFTDFNMDGRAAGDLTAGASTGTFTRGNSMGTDLNRQMPTVGSINPNRNPFQESETKYGMDFFDRIAKTGPDGKLAYGADVHGELTSRAYVDIMYPAGEFDSVEHRRLMAIAERTKSVIDDTLYAGIQDEIEEATGGNDTEGVEEIVPGLPKNVIPTKPAHWATVWDTLGYTDTGFIGDWFATDLAETGMDYEIMFNHTVPEKTWNVYLQENHINATRAIIKTAMAYALTQSEEFSDDNVVVDTVGRAGYVLNPERVTDADGVGRKAGPKADGIGADGKPVVQRSYDVSNQQFFTDTSRLMGDKPFVGVSSWEIANVPSALAKLDSLVLADVVLPADPKGRTVDRGEYFGALKRWVQDGGNLVLTDRGLHALTELGVVGAGAVKDIKVYQPYTDITDFSHRLVKGLRPNARQFVEAAALGYGIGNTASPETVVDTTAFRAAGGTSVGTTTAAGTSLGELALGKGVVRVVGGALPMPTEANDHRFGLRNYAPTYSGLFVLENAVAWKKPAGAPVSAGADATALLGLVGLVLPAGALAWRRRRA